MTSRSRLKLEDMMTKLHLSMTPSRGTMFGLPIDQATERLLQCAYDLDAATKKIATEREHLNVGQRLKQAIQARLHPRNAAATVLAESGDSFAEKLKRAVEKKSPAKRHKEQVERDRARYLRKPRPHTKGE
jgi:hypothetical protein